MRELFSCKHIVKTWLCRFPHLRDDDNKLIASFWAYEADDKGLDKANFLQDFSKGLYTSPESIRRMRQKLQEMNPELRGRNYGKRKKRAEEIRNEINRDERRQTI